MFLGLLIVFHLVVKMTQKQPKNGFDLQTTSNDQGQDLEKNYIKK